MFQWAKQQLANVAGTQEPIYGPDAIQSVAKQAETTPYTELQKDDLKWITLDYTCVETQTFYFTADNGLVGFVQVIYSNLAGIRTTCQFNSKIYFPDGRSPNIWKSDPLENYGLDDQKFSFYADNLAVTLSEDGTSYTIKSAVNDDSIVHLTMTRTAPGFLVGKNGTSNFGTDPNEPWGSMRHSFWPRCKVEGHIITKAAEFDLAGKGFFVHALQGMKPHHAAARWNFVNFQAPTYSAIMMEYTTPPSYGSTVVNVGAIVKDGEIILANASGTASHTEIKGDAEADWPEPSAVKFNWKGTNKDGKEVTAELAGPLGQRLDRVDVMAEVPGFVKMIVGSVAGTRPYIYQYAPAEPLTLKAKIGDEEVEDKGVLISEATFIS
ncbi:oxidative stress survival, Svf1-like protein [Xylona heveae TC161]|uniref:Ceramide-binding protein SVF1 n=1 Tax=Xylona heveae (strain CBS 132557 / TC161) TaxID=1328760 RepID=A0A164ZP43_XYLHT|nr:oxidative stress survival, Svf1-like protein [Xylona heveae TC161]KZF19333.1 oxidative stress survival, Svf1-like protein [Xylona heveae TC161]